MRVLLLLAFLTSAIVAAAQERHPAEVKGLRSTNGDLPTTITFVNRAGEPVKLYWLDYEGKRKLYETIPPGKQTVQPTFVTHPWLVTDAQDRPWGIYLPDAQPRTVEIAGGR